MKKELRTVFVGISILILALAASCAPASTPEPGASHQEAINADVAEVEKLAGFDVKEPTYLPQGVSFVSASYQAAPNPYVILQFKIKHESYGDMGNFFQIMQELQSEAPADVLTCAANTKGCEVLQINDRPVVYHQIPAGPEGLDWYADGFVFRLLRTAGEPNKVYKDELIKVVEHMQ